VVRGGVSASPAGREFEIAYVDAESGAQPCRRAEALDDEVEALVVRIVAKPRVAIALGRPCSTTSSSRASCRLTRMPGARWREDLRPDWTRFPILPPFRDQPQTAC
jgi:hypothetical protein